MTSSFAGTERVRSASTTTELYRACMQLSEEARSLQTQNEGMKRLGLNAQVLAAQTGLHGSALEVIVAEIGRLSGALREVLGCLGESARTLSTTAIEVLHLSHLRSPYILGREAGIEPSSATRYLETIQHVDQSRASLLGTLADGLIGVDSRIQDLSRIAQQIPPVTTMIRIVVTEIDSHSDALLGTVEDLKGFHANLDSKVERMQAIRGSGARRIVELRREDG